MNLIEEEYIRNYLLTQKLPIDLLMEVEDHFISQIMNLMREKEMNFEEAFLQTKSQWQPELYPYYDGGWNLEDQNRLVRQVRRGQLSKVIKLSSQWSAVGLLIVLLLAKYAPENIFSWFLILFSLTIILSPLAQYLRYRDDFKLIKQYSQYTLTYYQVGSSTVLSFLALNLNGIVNLILRQKPFTYFMKTSIIVDWWDILLFTLSILYILYSNVTILVYQQTYLKRIEKIRPFLNYLKKSN